MRWRMHWNIRSQSAREVWTRSREVWPWSKRGALVRVIRRIGRDIAPYRYRRKYSSLRGKHILWQLCYKIPREKSGWFCRHSLSSHGSWIRFIVIFEGAGMAAGRRQFAGMTGNSRYGIGMLPLFSAFMSRRLKNEDNKKDLLKSRPFFYLI